MIETAQGCFCLARQENAWRSSGQCRQQFFRFLHSDLFQQLQYAKLPHALGRRQRSLERSQKSFDPLPHFGGRFSFQRLAQRWLGRLRHFGQVARGRLADNKIVVIQLADKSVDLSLLHADSRFHLRLEPGHGPARRRGQRPQGLIRFAGIFPEEIGPRLFPFSFARTLDGDAAGHVPQQDRAIAVGGSQNPVTRGDGERENIAFDVREMRPLLSGGHVP